MVWVGVWNHGGGKIVRTHDNPHKIPSKSGFGPSHGDFTKQGHVWDPGKFLPQRNWRWVPSSQNHQPPQPRPPHGPIQWCQTHPTRAMDVPRPLLDLLHFEILYPYTVQKGFWSTEMLGLRHRKLDQPISLSRAYGLMGIINQLITRGCHLVDIYIYIYKHRT